MGLASPCLCRTPALHASLSCGSMPARPHSLTSVFTHSDHVFLGLPCFLVPGIGKFVIELIQDVASCTWPYHLSRRLRRTDVKSSMPSFFSNAAQGVSSQSMMPQIQQILAQSLWRSHCISGLFGPPVSLTWNISEQTQALYTLPHMLGERCLMVRTGKSFLKFSQATQHLVAMAPSQHPLEHSISPR